MPQAIPVSSRDRVETLDVLRGFALLGILAMNIRGMAAPLSAYLYPYALFDYSGASRAAYLFTSVVFDLKMMGLFSMLFGVSVLLYSTKSTESGQPPRGLWFRRMGWLLAIGLVHAYFIWGGDILVPYALCGMLILWWVRRLPGPALMAGAIALLGIGAALTIVHGLTWDGMTDAERAQEAAIMMPTPAQAREQLGWMLGSYTETVARHAPSVLTFQTLFFLTFFLWRCSGMMLLGMALYKWGFLDGRWSTRAYVQTAALCIPIGLGLAWYGTVELERARFALPLRILLDLWNYTGAVLASVGYAAVLILVVKHGALSRVRRALAAVGQMALSNYLLHSVVTSLLFLGWGVGLAGQFDYAEQLGVMVVIWASQLMVSPVWLARYYFGPAEWLWRSLTYWQRQPMRREVRPSSPLSGAVAGA
jgi:uncharacterized protein